MHLPAQVVSRRRVPRQELVVAARESPILICRSKGLPCPRHQKRSTMPAVACKAVPLHGRFFKVVPVLLREYCFSGDVVKKLQVSLFCMVRRAHYRCPSCLGYRPPCAVARLYHRRPNYCRLPSSLLLSDLPLLSPSEHCCLPLLLPPELLSLAFAIAARVTVAACNADVRAARVYRLQGLQAC